MGALWAIKGTKAVHQKLKAKKPTKGGGQKLTKRERLKCLYFQRFSFQLLAFPRARSARYHFSKRKMSSLGLT
jgi:hypothetical protein